MNNQPIDFAPVLDFNLETELNRIRGFLNSGGPDTESGRRDFLEWTKHMVLLRDAGLMKQEEFETLKQTLIPVADRDSIMGISLLKPYGYAGDFEVIDRVYTERMSKDPNLKNWDEWVQQTSGLQAVRNRKKYFKKLLLELHAKNTPVKILNIACGPCRDLLEFFEEVGDTQLQISCLDHDQNAINYAKNLLGEHSAKIDFIRANIFKFEASGSYDVIWSAGLFDYFDDITFSAILKRLYGWLPPNGKIIVGNFSWESETRFIKEFVEWPLHYRNAKDLELLAVKAGISPINISVDKEPLGVNLFLHLIKTD